jgi:hypothetical protein
MVRTDCGARPQVERSGRKAAVLQCFASFDGIAQHYWWVSDPSTAQNARRAVYEVFDPKLDTLRDFLSKQGKGQNARDLEIGVAWLLWLLGFSVANFGGTARTQCPTQKFTLNSNSVRVCVRGA